MLLRVGVGAVIDGVVEMHDLDGQDDAHYNEIAAKIPITQAMKTVALRVCRAYSSIWACAAWTQTNKPAGAHTRTVPMRSPCRFELPLTADLVK